MDANNRQLQEKLCGIWLEGGLHVGDDVFFLVGVEVLDDWEHKDWRDCGVGAAQRPSVDFLLADRHGYVWALALTQPDLSPMAARAVLCQLSMATARLASGISDATLQRAFECTHGGGDLRLAHRAFFDGAEPVPVFAWDKTIHRLLAGPDLDVNVQEQLLLFQGMSLHQLRARSRELGYAAAGEFRRLETFENSAQWLVCAQSELRAVDLCADDGTGRWLSAPWRVGLRKRHSRPFDTLHAFGAYTVVSKINGDENTEMLRAVANDGHPLARREFVLTVMRDVLPRRLEAMAALRASKEPAYETGEEDECPYRVEGPL